MFRPRAAAAAQLITNAMVQLRLTPPAAYLLTQSPQGHAWLVAAFNAAQVNRPVTVYTDPRLLKHLRTAIGGRPVIASTRMGLQYCILMSEKPRLPKVVDFTPDPILPDRFRLGLGLQGEVTLPITGLTGGIILGAAQGAGKSSTLHLIALQAHRLGWKLYLADPQRHTFSEIWGKVAAGPIAATREEMLALLDQVDRDYAERVQAFNAAAGPQGVPPVDLEAFNRVAPEKQPRVLIAVDEATFFLGDKTILARVATLNQQGRKFGLHFLLAGHDWHKRVIPSELNDFIQIRICLNVEVAESGEVVTRSSRWGRWVIGRPPGRGILRGQGKFQIVQFYRIPEEQIPSLLALPVCPLSALEFKVFSTALLMADGKLTLENIQTWADTGPWPARRYQDDWAARGLIAKDATQGNAFFLSEEGKRLVAASNHQTPQTASNPIKPADSAIKPASNDHQTQQTEEE